jgi:hypothetical protein
VRPQAKDKAQSEQLHLSPAKRDVFDEALKKPSQSTHGVLWTKMEDKMTGLLSRTLLIGDAFDAWVEWTVREIRVEMLYAKAVRRMTQQLCCSVFDNWSIITSSMKRARVVLARGVHRKQGRAFNSWRLNAHVARAARELGAANEEALKHMNASQQRAVKAALQKMQKQVATKVMNRWRVFVKEKNGIRYRMTKVIKRVANMKVAAAMTAWIAMVSEKQSMRNKMTKVIKRVANMKVAAAMSTWVAMAQDKKAVRERMHKVIKRVANMKVAAAMTAWIAMVSEKQSMRNKMTKVIKRVANMKVAAALARWVDMVVEAHTMRSKMTKVIKRVANLKLSLAHKAWTSMVQIAKQQRIRDQMEISNTELERVKAELAAYKAEHAAFEKRLDSLVGLPDFAIGAERLRKKGTPSPRSSGSPTPGRSRREGERSVLRARAAEKSPN